MKSKKAQAYIINRSTHMNCMGMTIVGLTTVEAKEACQIVEQEMREKAVEAHRNSCRYLFNDNPDMPLCDITGDMMECDKKCDYMKDFIQKLNGE